LNKILAKNAFVRVPSSPQPAWQEGIDAGTSSKPTLIYTHWWDGTPMTLPSEQEQEQQKECHNNSNNNNNDAEQQQMLQALQDKLYGGSSSNKNCEWGWPPGCVPYYKAFKGRSKTFTHHHV
jgi:hypothetical protein